MDDVSTQVSINIEQLQAGCPKLRVLRLTNSLIRLSQTPLKDQAASPGFPELEVRLFFFFFFFFAIGTIGNEFSI